MWSIKPVRLLIDLLILLICGAIIAGWLLRIAPGASVDERESDPRFKAESLAKIKARRDASRANTGRSFLWFGNALRGDLGVSEISGEPVASILAERTPLTLKTVLLGATGGFVLGIAAAVGATFSAGRMISISATGASLGILAVPSGLLSLFAIFLRLPVEVAVAVAVAPRTYVYALELFAIRARSGWMLCAYAAGVPFSRIFFHQLLPSVSGELGAVAGLSVVAGLAVTIPAEVLTGRPGLGQLAWTSAAERDLPVVIAVTLVMVVIARTVTLLSSLPARNGGAAV